MLDRIIDIIQRWIGLLIPFVIVAQYERAAVLTLGTYRGRELEPGFHWIWPLGIDDVHKDNVVPVTKNLKPQKLTTSDGVHIVIAVMVRHRIKDIVKFKLDIEDGDTVLTDAVYGVVGKQVRTSVYDALKHTAWHDELLKAVRKRAFRFGVEVEDLQVTDLARTRVLALVGDNLGNGS